IDYALPYITVIKDWLDANRELVKTRIEETLKKIMGFLTEAIPRLMRFVSDGLPKLIAFAKEWLPKIIKFFRETVPKAIDFVSAVMKLASAVLLVWGAFQLLNGVIAIFEGITSAIGIAKGAMFIFNAVCEGNPLVLIITGIVAAVALLITGFVLLTKKVGGIGPALEVVGQTIMKALLTPFNLVLDAVQGLMYGLGHVPGMDWAMKASESIGGFQDKINTAITGSSSTLLESGAKGAVAGYQEGGILGGIAGAAKGAVGTYTEPYNQHRADYLAEHPEELADSESAGFSKLADIFAAGQESMNAKLAEIATNTGDTATGVDNLGNGPSAPGKLNFAAMGAEDFWGTVRSGM
ncbi:MAG: hypothetical protein LBT39_01970, partial [Treponema sp.]|nr:hypothetical protein [Treponema sp.]